MSTAAAAAATKLSWLLLLCTFANDIGRASWSYIHSKTKTYCSIIVGNEPTAEQPSQPNQPTSQRGRQTDRHTHTQTLPSIIIIVNNLCEIARYTFYECFPWLTTSSTSDCVYRKFIRCCIEVAARSTLAPVHFEWALFLELNCTARISTLYLENTVCK